MTARADHEPGRGRGGRRHPVLGRSGLPGRWAMRRAERHEELLDGPLEDAAALRGNLRDLRRVNRLLGGTALSTVALVRLLDHVSGTIGGVHPVPPVRGAAAVQLLDVGTGAADIPLALLRHARRARLPLAVVAVDSRPEVLDAARAIDAALASPDAPRLVVADGRRLPWPDGSFDVAHASLVLHHLEPPDAVAFLAELRRVSRRGVIVNDLARNRLAWLFAIAGARLLTRNPLTRNDAPLSVRRAYTLPEVRDLLRAAGLRPVHVGLGLARYRFAIAAVPSDVPAVGLPAADAPANAGRAPERP